MTNRENLPSDTKEDWAFADLFFDSISNITKNQMNVTDIKIAPNELDIERATDYLLNIDNLHMACRIRELWYHKEYGDITIRSWRKSGATTELEKLAEGFGDIYFYGWGNPPTVSYYEIIDLHKCRPLIKIRYNLLKQGKLHEISNPDGQTKFIAIKPESLNSYHARIAFKHTDIMLSDFLK